MNKFKLLTSFIKRIWRLDRNYVLWLLFSRLLMAFNTIWVLLLPKILLDLVQRGAGFEESLRMVGSFLLAKLCLLLLQNLTDSKMQLEITRLDFLYNQEFSIKFMKIPYVYLEDNTYLQKKEAALMTLYMNTMERILTTMGAVLEQGFTLVGLVIVLSALGLPILLLLGVTHLIMAVILVINAKRLRKVMGNIVPINQALNHFVQVMANDKVQKDVRAYDLSELLVKNIRKYNIKMMEEFIDLSEFEGKTQSINQVLSLSVIFVVLYESGRRIQMGLAPLGNFALHAGAAADFSSRFKLLLKEIVNFLTTLNFLQAMEDFFELPEAEEALVPGSLSEGPLRIETIEFKDVSFRYPHSQEWVLQNLSFVIKPGEKISIVGQNGAGKSTLIKLLCGFFRPTKGQILINGQDLKDLNYRDYLKKVTAVFQDFGLLKLTLGENFKVQDDSPGAQRVLDLLSQVGLGDKMAQLPEGLNTYLGRHYHEEGTEFSGGQEQKMAIARALYKGGDVVILDEPTSALDPIAEADIYEHFNDLVQSKTAIYISHRMSSSTFCDRILVLEKGEKVAFASHRELMADQDGLYYKLFTAQASHYQRQRTLGEMMEPLPQN